MKINRHIADIAPQIKMVIGVLNAAGIRYQICGSIRRGEKIVGDCDMITSRIKDLDGLLSSLDADIAIMQRGKECRFAVDTVQFDVYQSDIQTWGAAVLWQTGDIKFWRTACKKARECGLKLSRRGLFDTAGLITGATEGQVLWTIGMDYRPPTQRRWIKFEEERKLRRNANKSQPANAAGNRDGRNG